MGKAKKADSMFCSYFSKREGKSGVQISFSFFSFFFASCLSAFPSLSPSPSLSSSCSLLTS